ncbi:MAG: cadherin-like beta sandwich domain-containing protein [Spirochaetes bacterium]|nr:cadherin-like beta sandwich domain-containing protein [Spirochaetota bacterium]
MKGFCKIFSALIVITALISVPGCVFNNIDVENAQNVLNDAVNDNNGIRGTVKITGMNDVSDCVVIVEKQIDGIKTATVFNTLYRSMRSDNLYPEDIRVIKTDKYGKFEATGLSEGKYTITVKKADTLGAIVKDIVIKNERALVDLDIVLTATGRLTGNVKLSDMTTDMFGSFVYAEGTSYIAATDGTGDFCIKDIPVGTYNIIFYREGYNTYRKVGVTITAAVDNPTGTIELGKISNNVYLSNLTVSNGVLSPAFDKGITYYDVSVDDSVIGIAFTPESEDIKSTIKINGITVASGTQSEVVEIKDGRNVFSIDVTSENGEMRNYITVVTRYSAYLSDLITSIGTLNPVFNKDVKNYSVEILRTSTMNITAFVDRSDLLIKVRLNNGSWSQLISGLVSNDFQITLGDNTIDIMVINDVSNTSSIYSIIITRTYLSSGYDRNAPGNLGALEFMAIASSWDGTKLAAVVEDGYIYTSTDSGTTWTEQKSSGYRRWFSIASSSDGTKLAAVVFNGYIYTSTDSGATWTERTSSGIRGWRSIASSSDGTKLAAGADGEYIYTSTDSGATWAERTTAGSRVWISITSSSDGTKLAAVAYNGYIYTSTNSGATWTERTSSGIRGWHSIASSIDGTKLAAVALSSGYIYTSTDSGATWTERTISGAANWRSIASSSDGTKLAVVADYRNIYTSTDSGATWTEQTSSGSWWWYSIASSSDGTKLAAGVYNGNNGGYIYTSTDSGATWTERTSSGSRGWRSIALSSDGTKLAAVVNNGYIYTSTDSGATWIEQTSSGIRVWYSIASSSDGTKLAAVVTNGYIYTSTDSGATWTEQTSSGSRNWYSIASSSDGTKLAAVVTNGYIYTSTDSGATWTEQTSSGSRNWYSITSSSDGTKLAAVVNNGYICTSLNSGITWTGRTSAGSRLWSSITSSSDGAKLAAVVTNGYIYTSTDSGVTWTERTSSGSRNWYSITSSSDGTKLAAVVANGYIYTSSDYGAIWSEETSVGARYWKCIASSSNWETVAAVEYVSRIIFVSNNE